MPIRMSGLTSGLDTEAIVEALVTAQKTKTTKIENKLTKSEWTKEIWTDLNKKLYSFYTQELTKFKTQGNYKAKKVTSSNDSIASATATSSAANGSHTLEIRKLAAAQSVTSGEIDAGSTSAKLTDLGMQEGTVITINSGDQTKEVKVTKEATLGGFLDACKSVGLNASFDKNQKRLFISSSKSGKDSGFSITAQKPDVESEGAVDENGAEEQLSFLGLQSINKDMATGNYGGMSYVQASDSEIVLDGAVLSSNSNEFSVNGLSINLKSVTAEGQSVTLNTTTDVDAVYNMVKDFVKKYNEILEELNDKHDAKSAKGYDPLTDEQKEAMTEDQIEKWETKIKDALLRRDGTLNGIITGMRSSLFTTTKVDGVAYSLSSFGIMTSSDYTEKGKLHIFGDPDDETYSTKTNKLKEAIESNPDAVMKTLADAGQALYETLTKKMERTSLSSALTFYNDKKMDSEQSDYKKQIKELEKKLTAMEDRYYKQFTAMEKAMTQMQSQTNALSSLTGYTG